MSNHESENDCESEKRTAEQGIGVPAHNNMLIESDDILSDEVLGKETTTLVRDLIYWKCPMRSGAALSFIMMLLISLSICSIISVLAYFGLIVLAISLSLKAYVNFVGITDKTPQIIQSWFREDFALKESDIDHYTQKVLNKVRLAVSTVYNCFIIRDYVQSIKFGAVLYFFTYIGAWFNFLTLCIIVAIGAFTLPMVYEMNKDNLDKLYETLKSHGCATFSKCMKQAEGVIGNLPGIGKKQKST